MDQLQRNDLPVVQNMRNLVKNNDGAQLRELLTIVRASLLSSFSRDYPCVSRSSFSIQAVHHEKDDGYYEALVRLHLGEYDPQTRMGYCDFTLVDREDSDIPVQHPLRQNCFAPIPEIQLVSLAAWISSTFTSTVREAAKRVGYKPLPSSKYHQYHGRSLMDILRHGDVPE